jgi:hypothetical protein
MPLPPPSTSFAWSGFRRVAREFQGVAGRDLRQALVVLVLRHVVAAFLVDLEEPVEEDHLPRRAQLHLAVLAGHGDRVRSSRAASIWLAMVRFQIRS